MASQTTTAGQSAGQFGNWLNGVKQYFEDLKSEMRRVTWPTRTQVQATTTVVIVSVFLFAAYFALVDLLLGNSVNWMFRALTGRH